jgi:hypothetical protein
MKTPKLGLIIGLMLLSTPAFAYEDEMAETAQTVPASPSMHMFLQADANSDGFVSKAEWTTYQTARFDRADKDQNSMLTKDEYSHLWDKGNGPTYGSKNFSTETPNNAPGYLPGRYPSNSPGNQ